MKILEHIGAEVAGTWGSVTGLTVLTVNGVYWILAIPNLWTFSKEKLRKWFCFCQEEEEVEDNLIDMLYANPLAAAAAAREEHSFQTAAVSSNHI